MVAYGIISGISGISASSEKRKKFPSGEKIFPTMGKSGRRPKKKDATNAIENASRNTLSINKSCKMALVASQKIVMRPDDYMAEAANR